MSFDSVFDVDIGLVFVFVVDFGFVSDVAFNFIYNFIFDVVSNVVSDFVFAFVFYFVFDFVFVSSFSI